ncbi:MAG: nucleotidyltransferase family protein [Thermoleophilia bacterium]|nr:nucleotidyltransferase family protein [Thermoleophilia bacterium]
MTLAEVVRAKREQILEVSSRHGAYNVRVFGSLARDESGSDSDLDLLVDVGTHHSPWFPAGLIADLEEILGYEVDVVTEGGLHERARAAILEEARPL